MLYNINILIYCTGTVYTWYCVIYVNIQYSATVPVYYYILYIILSEITGMVRYIHILIIILIIYYILLIHHIIHIIYTVYFTVYILLILTKYKRENNSVLKLKLKFICHLTMLKLSPTTARTAVRR